MAARNLIKRKANLKRIASLLEVTAWNVEAGKLPPLELVRISRRAAERLRREADRKESESQT